MKKILMFVCAILFTMILSGCQHVDTIFDVPHTANLAAIKLEDGTIIQAKIEPWGYFDDSNQLQAKIQVDGVDYLIYIEND